MCTIYIVVVMKQITYFGRSLSNNKIAQILTGAFSNLPELVNL